MHGQGVSALDLKCTTPLEGTIRRQWRVQSAATSTDAARVAPHMFSDIFSADCFLTVFPTLWDKEDVGARKHLWATHSARAVAVKGAAASVEAVRVTPPAPHPAWDRSQNPLHPRQQARQPLVLGGPNTNLPVCGTTSHCDLAQCQLGPVMHTAACIPGMPVCPAHRHVCCRPRPPTQHCLCHPLSQG